MRCRKHSLFCVICDNYDHKIHRNSDYKTCIVTKRESRKKEIQIFWTYPCSFDSINFEGYSSGRNSCWLYEYYSHKLSDRKIYTGFSFISIFILFYLIAFASVRLFAFYDINAVSPYAWTMRSVLLWVCVCVNDWWQLIRRSLWLLQVKKVNLQHLVKETKSKNSLAALISVICFCFAMILGYHLRDYLQQKKNLLQ